MSRIGNMPISLPEQVSISGSNQQVTIKGPKGELALLMPGGISIDEQDHLLFVKRQANDKKSKALHGLMRAKIANYVKGVTVGWTKLLELSGVGYRASMSGNNLVLTVGFSHPVTITPPENIQLSLSEGKIVVSGLDKQLVGQIAAKIRAVKAPEPYKGKGIKYSGERIRKKAGKAAKAVGGAQVK